MTSGFHPFASPNDAVRFEWVAGFGRCLGVPTIRGALLQNERMTRVAVDLWLVLQQQIEAWRLHVVSQTRIPEQVNLGIHQKRYRAH